MQSLSPLCVSHQPPTGAREPHRRACCLLPHSPVSRLLSEESSPAELTLGLGGGSGQLRALLGLSQTSAGPAGLGTEVALGWATRVSSPLECESEASGLQVYRQAPVRGSRPPAGTHDKARAGGFSPGQQRAGVLGVGGRADGKQTECRNALEGSQR